ncbi:MAG: CRISPR-associated endoribonuclease Cas6 [Tissierellia bacterium]|nr:CRISPR-associated endoribonuclease Cas6 [Tissierellia bacterium]
MRLKLEFSLKEKYIPIDYHKLFLKFIKKSISEYQNGKFFDMFYNDDISKNTEKTYSWSVGFKDPIFKNGYIDVNGKKVNLVFVIPSMKNSLILLNSFMDQKDKEMKVSEKNYMKLESVKILREKKIKGNLFIAKILSPIIIRDHNRDTNKDVYYSVDDNEFISELKKKLKRDCPSYEKEIDDLMIDTSNAKKIVVTLYGQKINSTIGNLVFIGDKNLLNYLYNSSIGSRKSLGFGVIEEIFSGELKK